MTTMLDTDARRFFAPFHTKPDMADCGEQGRDKRRQCRACTHKSPDRVRFRANRTLSQHRRMTDFDP